MYMAMPKTIVKKMLMYTTSLFGLMLLCRNHFMVRRRTFMTAEDTCQTIREATLLTKATVVENKSACQHKWCSPTLPRRSEKQWYHPKTQHLHAEGLMSGITKKWEWNRWGALWSWIVQTYRHNRLGWRGYGNHPYNPWHHPHFRTLQSFERILPRTNTLHTTFCRKRKHDRWRWEKFLATLISTMLRVL